MRSRTTRTSISLVAATPRTPFSGPSFPKLVPFDQSIAWLLLQSSLKLVSQSNLWTDRQPDRQHWTGLALFAASFFPFRPSACVCASASSRAIQRLSDFPDRYLNSTLSLGTSRPSSHDSVTPLHGGTRAARKFSASSLNLQGADWHLFYFILLRPVSAGVRPARKWPS